MASALKKYKILEKIIYTNSKTNQVCCEDVEFISVDAICWIKEVDYFEKVVDTKERPMELIYSREKKLQRKKQ